MRSEKLIKEERGITLIALVITIIVLLILAGVSVSMITGNEGILIKAQEAKEEYKLAEETELRQLTMANAAMNLENKEYTDGEYNTATIPAGFAVSDVEGEQTMSTGLVIIDAKGNEFVWVPVDGQNIEYIQDTETYKSMHIGGYEDYIDWEDDGGKTYADGTKKIDENKASVAKYGGFYIARYEAGWDENVTNGTTYETDTTKNINTKIPISKAKVPSWNYISQENAKTVSENMYKNSTSVTSGLVDSYAWDTTCDWLLKTGKISVNSDSKINSAGYGNYFDSNFTVQDSLYAWHIVRDVNKGQTGEGGYVKISDAYNGENKMLQLGGVTISDNDTDTLTNLLGVGNYDTTIYAYTKRLEIETGASEVTKLNNIYDLAGNMWEWTTETGNHEKTDGTKDVNEFCVLRGGSFSVYGNRGPIVGRDGRCRTDQYLADWGFRVVLYIK